MKLFDVTSDDDVEKLVDNIEKWPLIVIDTKSGARMKFENGDQLKAWLNPFKKTNDIFGGIL